ncbi:hypothetical protein [Synechocystis sp. CACIAM 05]|uniref:hypothetical protein n=1 Tax=Synechocystis sp. CACIAM 05 TaxID=1933929 RepID=UPI00138E7DB4|nr:hypothetical protein [Synechocystis sp. CACIAM 05]QHV01491.1 hypothetical protein BWK47_16030 [Synechocystis sp. CACIAM 05]
MFTKFNRVLLASGLVLTSLVGFGSSAFAEDIRNGTETLIGTELPKATLTWTGATTAFNMTYGEAYSGDLGTVTVVNNIIGAWRVTVEGDATPGLLDGQTMGATNVKIPYTVKLTQLENSKVGNGLDVTPGVAANVDRIIASDTITNTPIDGSGALTMSIAAADTKVVAQTYQEILKLVLTVP